MSPLRNQKHFIVQNVTSYMQLCLQGHLEDKDKMFIQDVKVFPESAIVLATDQQLYDVELLCCNPTFLQ